MIKIRIIAVVLCVAGVMIAPHAFAAVGIYAPINYQGKLTNMTGTVIADGTHSMRFKIFSASGGGVPLWTETWDGTSGRITSTGGLFSIALGTHTAMTGSVNFNSDSLFLQVEFDPGNDGNYEEVFSPRRRLASVPYAHNAGYLNGFTASQFLRSDTNSTSSGTLTIITRNASKVGMNILVNGSSPHIAALKLSTEGSNHIIFGASGGSYDTNLYRSSVSTLRTDGAFQVVGTLSGSNLIVSRNATISGALLVKGNITTRASFSGASLRIMSGTASYFLGSVGIGKSSGFKARFEVAGSISGSRLYVASAFSGAGLSNCTSSSEKLLWNATTQKFSCGTDESSYSAAGTGNVITIGNARYIQKSGGAMTGALTINLTQGYLGLNILQTASGKVLHAEKTLSSSGTIVAEGSIRSVAGSFIGRAFVFASGTTLAEMSGNNSFVNLTRSGLGTNGVIRLTQEGDLVNIPSIQAGQTHLRRGGTFNPKVDYATGTSPYAVAVGDFNSDGYPDTVATNVGANTVSIFLNNGNGTFAAKVDYGTGTAPDAVAIGDLNGDGKPDLAVTNDNSNTVSILLNNGDGTFQAKVDYVTGGQPFSVAIGDMDNDGKSDVIVANATDDTVSILLNRGRAILDAKVDYSAGNLVAAGGREDSLSIGDIDGDGKMDVAVVNNADTTVSILKNTGAGILATRVTYTTASSPRGVAISDFNGDGKPDLGVTGGNGVSILLNAGTGSFAAKVDYTAGANASSISANDLNGDGTVDMAIANMDDDTVSILLNNGNGTFQTKIDYAVGDGPSSIDTGDLNGDGVMDVVAGNTTDSTISVLLNSSRTIFFASAGTGGAIGIGTSTPGSALSVSGAVIISKRGNLANRKASGSTTVEVQGGTGQTLLLLNSESATGTTSVFKILSEVNTGLGAAPDNLVFRIGANGATYSDSAYSSAGADYAEWFFSTDTLAPGELVCIDPLKSNTVIRCTRSADPNLMGIVSTNPAFIGNHITGAMGLPVPGYALIGLIGQVPTKVTLENGPIYAGDALTSASLPGFARRADAGESTVGVALEPFTATGTTNIINVLISRRNQSLTVETVEQKVRDSVASMNISDEINQMVQTASLNLNLDAKIQQSIDQQLAQRSFTGTTFHAAPVDLPALAIQIAALFTSSGSTFALPSDPTTLQILADLQSQFLSIQSSLSSIVHFGSGHSLVANSLEVHSGATINGTLTLSGSLHLTGSSAILGPISYSGSSVQIGSLFASGALKIYGPITIAGLADFLGDVNIHGELRLSSRQAGFATIGKGSTTVTVPFNPPFTTVPVVNANANARVGSEWWIEQSSATGFVIRIDKPAEQTIPFTWTALTSNEVTTTENAEVALIPFPVDNFGRPFSAEDAVWTGCVQGKPLLDASGMPYSCSRYHSGYVWEHSDLNISFIYNPNHEPPILTIPEGYILSQSAEETVVPEPSIAVDDEGITNTETGSILSTEPVIPTETSSTGSTTVTPSVPSETGASLFIPMSIMPEENSGAILPITLSPETASGLSILPAVIPTASGSTVDAETQE